MKKTLTLIATCMLLFVSFLTTSSLAAGPKDIERDVTIKSAKILYLDNNGYYSEIVKGESYPIGTKIKVSITWEISDLSEISVNDYFVFQLPVDYLHFSHTTSPIPLLSSDGLKTELGSYTISKTGLVTVTLNETGASQDQLLDGEFDFSGYISKSGKDLTIDILDTTYENIVFEDRPTASFPEYSPKNEYGKIGSQVSNNNQLSWSIFANRIYGKQWFEYLTGATTNRPADMNNLVMTDTLSPGQSFRNGSMKIRLPLFVATADGKMSVNSAKLLVTDQFKKITQAPGQSYTDFYNNVVANAPSYGVYDSNRIIVSFGNLPYNGVSTKISDAELEALFIKDAKVTDQTQLDLSVAAYSETNEIQGNAVGYYISFETDVTGDSGTYTNQAIFTHENGSGNSNITEVEFTEVSGSVKPIDSASVLLTKIDTNGRKLAGAEFDLYMYGQSTPIKANLSTNSDGELLVKNLLMVVITLLK